MQLHREQQCLLCEAFSGSDSSENDSHHNLQFYLANKSEYFSSNVQLQFLSGIHYLHEDLFNKKLDNFSMIGAKTNNNVPQSIIHCIGNPYSGISFINCRNISLVNIKLQNCQVSVQHYVTFVSLTSL